MHAPWRTVAVVLLAGVLVNACSWTPGYGGRRDQQPGMEVERYFGWPACFRAELWRSDHPHQVDVGAYVPPIPLSNEMSFVYARSGWLPLLLDVALVAIAAALGLLISRKRSAASLPRAAVVLAALGGLLVLLAGLTSVYL